MMALPDIEAQLSYAYLHTVASHAGITCQEARRSLDKTHGVVEFGKALFIVPLHVANVAPPLDLRLPLVVFVDFLGESPDERGGFFFFHKQ